MKRFVWLIVCFCFSFIALLSSCSNSKVDLNAKILNDNASELINDDFYNNNHTRGAYYDDDQVCDNSDVPQLRSFIIKTQEEFQTVFLSNTKFDIDFQNEMIIVCTYTSNYVRPVEIDSLKIDSTQIYVELIQKKRDFRIFGNAEPDAVKSFQRYVIIKIQRTDVSEIEFKIH